MQRLEAAPPIAAAWLAHQREDDYWRQGSVGFAPERICLPRLPRRRLGRPLQRGHPAPARGVDRPGEGADRALGPRLSRAGRAGARARLGAGGGPLVAPLAGRRGDRDHGGAQGVGLHAGAVAGAGRGRASPAAGSPSRLAAGDAMIARAAPEPRGASASSAATAFVSIGGEVVGLQTPEWCPFSPPQYAAGAVRRTTPARWSSTPRRWRRRSRCSGRRSFACASRPTARSPSWRRGSARSTRRAARGS